MKVVDALIFSLEKEPGEWSENHYALQRDNVAIWIANGSSCFHLYYPVKIDFTFWERYKLAIAIDKWKNNVAIKTIIKDESK